MNQAILLIDTAGVKCHIALFDGPQLIEEVSSIKERAHSEELCLMLKGILDKHSLKAKELKGLGINIGPGSYTGLRVGISVIKGLLFQTNVPVLGIPYHEQLLYDPKLPKNKNSYLVILHKRKDEYISYYYDGHFKLIKQEDLKLSDIQRIHKETEIFSPLAIESIKVSIISATARQLIYPSIKRLSSSLALKAHEIEPIYFQAPYITKRKKELL